MKQADRDIDSHNKTIVKLREVVKELNFSKEVLLSRKKIDCLSCGVHD
jgi:hypothetical protein